MESDDRILLLNEEKGREEGREERWEEAIGGYVERIRANSDDDDKDEEKMEENRDRKAKEG